MLRRIIGGAGVALTLLGLSAVPAAACGGLVAANGAVRLARATTMVAWHDGVEHYVTSFTYQGVATGVGWVVPLPAVPEKIIAAGRWTLQRLDREFNPPPASVQFAVAAPGLAAGSAQVLQQTQVEAVDITVLRGSAPQVIQWCKDNNFALNDETRAHIELYGKASPIFMAARYDVDAARRLGRFQGDGTPVLITMHTPHLWVPLEVLANAQDPVDADVFLLTDRRPVTGEESSLFDIPSDSVGDRLPGAEGFTVQAQEFMNLQLHNDLASDRNMSWVPNDAWVTHLVLNAPSPTVTYDMSLTGDGVMQLASLGTAPEAAATQPPQAQFTPHPHLTGVSVGAVAALLAVPMVVVLLVVGVRVRRRGQRVA
jgi:hypothetical protein